MLKLVRLHTGIYHMNKLSAPTPDELKKSEDALEAFQKKLTEASYFNSPLTKSERALLKTFHLFLQVRSRSEDQI